MILLEEVLQHGLDHEVDQSQAKGVKKYAKAPINDQLGGQGDGAQVQAYYFDKKRFKVDQLRALPEQARSNMDTARYKIIYLDPQRAYFWRLLVLFYQNLILQTVDYDLYPYISVQLVNVVSCGIARQAALQSELYFEPIDSLTNQNL